MEKPNSQSYTAFEGFHLFAQGPLDEVILKTKRKLKSEPASSIQIFSDLTGKEMDFDLRGSEKEILQRLQVFLQPMDTPTEAPGPGRPKLGVVSREVSLLPRHWEWLSTQSGGASAVLRRLVETEMKNFSQKESIKQVQERTYKFLSAIAGNLPQFEEALRALYARDKKKFKEMMSAWPKDVQTHALSLSSNVFEK